MATVGFKGLSKYVCRVRICIAPYRLTTYNALNVLTSREQKCDSEGDCENRIVTYTHSHRERQRDRQTDRVCVCANCYTAALTNVLRRLSVITESHLADHDRLRDELLSNQLPTARLPVIRHIAGDYVRLCQQDSAPLHHAAETTGFFLACATLQFHQTVLV